MDKIKSSTAFCHCKFFKTENLMETCCDCYCCSSDSSSISDEINVVDVSDENIIIDDDEDCGPLPKSHTDNCEPYDCEDIINALKKNDYSAQQLDVIFAIWARQYQDASNGAATLLGECLKIDATNQDVEMQDAYEFVTGKSKTEEKTDNPGFNSNIKCLESKIMQLKLVDDWKLKADLALFEEYVEEVRKRNAVKKNDKECNGETENLVKIDDCGLCEVYATTKATIKNCLDSISGSWSTHSVCPNRLSGISSVALKEINVDIKRLHNFKCICLKCKDVVASYDKFVCKVALHEEVHRARKD